MSITLSDLNEQLQRRSNYYCVYFDSTFIDLFLNDPNVPKILKDICGYTTGKKRKDHTNRKMIKIPMHNSLLKYYPEFVNAMIFNKIPVLFSYKLENISISFTNDGMYEIIRGDHLSEYDLQRMKKYDILNLV